ncbi:MAG: VTT domain-containing protein [Candidatus Palauibacterales bacterium]|nr:VTT domain-containing protein [Candidatus Palauibacterales bacterium]
MTADDLSRRSWLARAWRALTRERGNRTWDGVIRGTGLLAALSIPLVLILPETAAMTGFVLVTIWVNGPISPLLPATYEPILMLFGRVYDPFLVAALGTAGTLYVEWLNYYLYRAVLTLDGAAGFRESRMVRKVIDLFERKPFLAVWLCSWSILPYWPVRILAAVAGYDVRRHLLATLLGRLPRLWFFAALGLWWDIPDSWLVWATGGGIAVGVTIWAWRRWRGAEEPGPPAPARVREEERPAA